MCVVGKLASLSCCMDSRHWACVSFVDELYFSKSSQDREFNNSFKQRYLISGKVSEYRYFFRYGFFNSGRWRLTLENLILFFLFFFLVLTTFLIFFYFVEKIFLLL